MRSFENLECIKLPSVIWGARFVVLFMLFAGYVYADPNPEPQCSGDIGIWPKGAKVLTEGKTLSAHDKSTSQDMANAVINPTITVYHPKPPSSRTAIIVFPGGGYKGLAIGKDSTIGINGSAVAKWLNSNGIACVLLIYRVPNSDCYWDEKTKRHVTPEFPMALQDAQRAISTLRYNAKKYDLDPNKIGVMGFSAGGNLAVLSSTAFNKRSYQPIDEIDCVSCKPDFAIPVYPGHMTMEHKNMLPKNIAATQLNTDIEVSREIPPTLLVHAKDDSVDPIHYSLVYEGELKKVGVQVKLNVYKNGGHAFGVSKSGKATDKWTEDAVAWLKEIGIL